MQDEEDEQNRKIQKLQEDERNLELQYLHDKQKLDRNFSKLKYKIDSISSAKIDDIKKSAGKVAEKSNRLPIYTTPRAQAAIPV